MHTKDTIPRGPDRPTKIRCSKCKGVMGTMKPGGSLHDRSTWSTEVYGGCRCPCPRDESEEEAMGHAEASDE